MKKGILFVLMTSALCILADEPLPKPVTYKQYSPNKMYVADVSLETKTITVSLVGQDKRTTEVWRISGWFRWVFVANNGQYISIPYNGGNLLARDYKKDEERLRIIKQGKIVKIVKLNELISDYANLRRTVSHYDWGKYLGFNKDNEFILETVEHIWFFINPDTGIIRKEKAPIQEWQMLESPK